MFRFVNILSFIILTLNHPMNALLVRRILNRKPGHINKFNMSYQSTRDNIVFEKPTLPLSNTLRNINVINFSGKAVNLNNIMKDNKSIVVFLRHLG